MASVTVPADRVARWVANFAERHGATSCAVVDGELRGAAEDGSTFAARLPFDRAYDGPAEASVFAAHVRPPEAWGLLLVRKGGFAIARLAGTEVLESKVGQRHVQGRTKAGGQSQQRFARRRDNQARAAFEAAAEHAARILAGARAVVTGGDHAAVDDVLGDARLQHLSVLGPWLPVPDPKRAVLEQAVRDASSARIDVVNAPA